MNGNASVSNNVPPIHPSTMQEKVTRSTLRKVILGGGIGNLVEWFDFAVYGYLASTIATLFFPNQDPTVSLLATFATFGVSFLLRPLGGVYFGALGDKFGRRNTLSLVIVLMSASTFVIGLLPTHGQVGVLAPVLLVLARCIQGFSAGGEYAGASSFVIEYAPANRRAFFASALPASTTLAFVLAAGLSALLSATIPQPDFVAWGWRIPFLLAGPLGLLGLYLRLRLEDTPAFHAVKKAGTVAKAPLKETLRTQRKPIFILFGFLMTNSVGYYLLATYLPTYFQTNVGLGKTEALVTNMLALVVLIILTVVFARVADRFGRKPVALGACIGFVVLTLPAFYIAQQGTAAALLAAQGLLALAQAGTSAVTSLLLVEMFPTRVRYSCASISYNLAYMIFGGTAPFVATWLVATTHQNLAPAFYVIAVAVVSTLVVLKMRETKGISLVTEEDVAGNTGPAVAAKA